MRDTRTRTEKLAGAIADAIIAGEWAPGERLDEQAMAVRYGVSRTPVREALRQLGASGLIELRPRRGAVVALVTPEELDELFVAMAEIEATCARLAALGMSPVNRRRLESLHDAMGELVKAEDAAAYAEANTAFHGTIYLGARNAVLAEVAIGLRRRLLPYRQAQFRAPDRLTLSFGEHAAIVDAICHSDASRAHAAMLHHVGLVERAVDALGKVPLAAAWGGLIAAAWLCKRTAARRAWR
jgi:DNA-binding GntR family transcriptional regulator